MRPKLFSQIVIVSFIIQILLFINTSNAQCTGRYLDTTTFASVDSFTNVVYTDSAGGDSTELMNVYQPHGDTACLRHLIIWMHGGAFFEGSKDDGDIKFLCYHFAQRGYVCATINYRLASSIVVLYDSAQIFTHAYQGFSDLKAAIRYFYKEASNTNHWNIDTTSFFIGGSSAGAIDADLVSTLDSVGELAAPFQTIANANGGITGNSGNSGYSTHVTAVASLAGAVNSVSWIKPGVPPMVMCQGTADGTIPYYCGLALTQYTLGLYPTINFCGSGEMAPALDSAGVAYSLLPFPGSGHVPWDTNTTIMYRTDSAVAAFFYQVKCTQAAGHCTEPAGIANITNTPQLTIYPNPATDLIQIKAQGQNELLFISLYDYTGREIMQLPVTGNEKSLSVKDLSPGIYSLRVDFRDATPVTRKVIIE